MVICNEERIAIGKEWQQVACSAVIRSDTWTQKLTIAEELESEGVGQRWYCHCGGRYSAKFGVLVEMIDRRRFLGLDGGRPCGLYFHAKHPDQDIKDLKTMFREQALKNEGLAYLTPEQVHARVPKVEPRALGSVLVKYAPNTPKWEGHWHLASGLDWESLPEWHWDDFYSQFGLDPRSGKRLGKRARKTANAKWWKEQKELQQAATGVAPKALAPTYRDVVASASTALRPPAPPTAVPASYVVDLSDSD